MTLAEREEEVRLACRLAGINPEPRQPYMAMTHPCEMDRRVAAHNRLLIVALTYLLVDGMRPGGIRFKLRRDLPRLRGEDFREMLESALRRIVPYLADYWQPAVEFARQLLQCAANRRDYDDRPAGVCGVTSAPAADRFQGMQVLSADDARIRQGVIDAGRLWRQARLVPA